jgi:UDP:flavonoid glycosyltransferase YjiC (YdhE family)
MRVLVSTTAGTGHFGPLIPFARACLEAGHEVVVAAPKSFVASVSAAGFEHRSFADAPAEMMGAVFEQVPRLSFEQANALVVTEVFGRLDPQASLPGLVEIINAWRPDLVLREPYEFGSLVAARRAGIPQVAVAIGMTATTEYMTSLIAQPLAELDTLAGLPDGAAADAMLSAPTFTTVPSILDEAQGDGAKPTALIHRFHDASLTSGEGALPEPWGNPLHPLVYVTFGSVTAAVGGFKTVYSDVVAAFADHDVRVLLTTGVGLDPSDLEPLPTNTRVERWWPQAQVMAHCDAVVGHGGFGTTMTALAAGVPQVIVPLFAYDQLINAEHVKAVGAGLQLGDGPQAIADAPEAAKRLVSEPSYREAARSVAHSMATLPPAADAVALLERTAHP